MPPVLAEHIWFQSFNNAGAYVMRLVIDKLGGVFCVFEFKQQLTYTYTVTNPAFAKSCGVPDIDPSCLEVAYTDKDVDIRAKVSLGPVTSYGTWFNVRRLRADAPTDPTHMPALAVVRELVGLSVRRFQLGEMGDMLLQKVGEDPNVS